jgi:hypothetical protein
MLLMAQNITYVLIYRQHQITILQSLRSTKLRDIILLTVLGSPATRPISTRVLTGRVAGQPSKSNTC